MKKSKILTNSGLSLICKIISAGIGIISVPILINVLGIEQYGIWVTLVSIIGWFQMSDFGLANGLKNKVTELNALKDSRGVAIYFIGSVQIYFLIAVLLTLSLPMIIKYLNMPAIDIYIIYLLYIPFILCLPLTLGTAVLSGLRKVGLLSCLSIMTPIIWLLIIFYLNNRYTVSLLPVAIGWSISNILGTFLIYIYTFIKTQASIYELVNFKNILKVFSIVKLSGKFFVLQISSVVLYSMGNYLVYCYLGPGEAARYDTVNKLFLFGMTLYNVIIAVVWPEFTHYFTVGNYQRAWQLYKKLVLSTVALCVCVSIGSSLIPWIISIWTHGKLSIQIIDLVPFIFLICVQMLAYSGAVVLNAAGQVSGQIVLSILASIGMVPLATYYFKTGFSIMAVPLATAVLTVPATIYCSLQAYRILSRELRGE